MYATKVPPWSLYSTGLEDQSIQFPDNENHGFTADNIRKLAIELLTDPELGTRSRVVNPFSEEGMREWQERQQERQQERAPAPTPCKAPPPEHERNRCDLNYIIMSV